MPSSLKVETVDPDHASEEILQAMARHIAALSAERMPEDPVLPPGSLVAGLRHPAGGSEHRYVLVWNGPEVAAQAEVRLPTLRVHVASLDLSVRARDRRKGLARRLLHEVLATVLAHDRRLLLTHTSSRLPAGEAVLRHLGADPVMRQQFLQLDLQRLPTDLLPGLIRPSEARASDYRVWTQLGAYPAERLADIADLQDVMNTAPQGRREPVTSRTTIAQLLEEQDTLRLGGRQRITTFAEHRSSGRLVASTELRWELQRAGLVFQYATVVHPEHRRQALGRWIKAANLQEVVLANPEARFVRAGNTDDNMGMLAINRDLGFTPYSLHTDWQLTTAALQTYLVGTTA